MILLSSQVAVPLANSAMEQAAATTRTLLFWQFMLSYWCELLLERWVLCGRVCFALDESNQRRRKN